MRLLGAFLALSCTHPPPTEIPVPPSVPVPISLSEVVTLPPPGMGGPTALAEGPGGVVTFLEGEGLVRSLWALDPRTGARTQVATAPGGGVREGSLSIEAKLRRERLRERGLGISRYRWSTTGDTLLVPLGDQIWVQRGLDGALTFLADGATDPQLSPDGRAVAYVHDRELFVLPIEGGDPRQLTSGADAVEGRSHGLAEYIAQEEMNRYHGFWWSTDGRWIAFTEVDEGHVPVWRIPHQAADEPRWEDHRYPFPGADNARVSLWVVPADGSAPPRQLPLTTPDGWEYLARVIWLTDGTLVAAVQDRRQKRLDLVKLDPEGSAPKTIRTEHDPAWIDLHRVMHPLRDPAGSLLWGTLVDGFRHLLRLDPDGGEEVLTSGAWGIDALTTVDEAKGVVYLHGSEASPLERHLYRVPLTAGPIERLTPEAGWHDAVVTSDHVVDTYSDLSQPPTRVIRSLGDAPSASWPTATDPRLADLGLRPPELVEVTQRDGVALHGALYRPEGTGPWPLVVSVYGGPHVQKVKRAWELTADLRSQYLARRGIAVFRLDNRGSSRRGLAFEAAIAGNMGDLELLDQIDGVQWLVDQGIVDPDRVGITGWSYGGYLSAMAVCRHPDRFTVAVAGAPVTHWDSYDTHYTERYMGLPEDNPEGYAVSSVMHHVSGLRGDLMLIHGMLDENVHFRHTARLIDALLSQGKDATLRIYPGERHAPRDPAGRLTLLEQEMSFLEASLTR